MTRERESQEHNGQPEFQETLKARPLTHGEFYLAMTERPGRLGLGLRPELRSLFVGQDRAYKQLYDAITQSPAGTVVAIPAPFGAGKDALFDVVVKDLMDQGKIKGEEAQKVWEACLEEDKSFEHTKRIFSWVAPENPQSIRPKVLAVNELAYGHGHSKESLQKQLTIAGNFLGKEVPVMVLIGDYALEDPEIVGAVGSPYKPIVIKLDPLTPAMLMETLRRRVAYALERSPEEIDVDTMIDPEFLSALFPNTEYPIATMRTSLVVLGSIGRRLKPTEEPLRISQELARKVYLGNELYEDFWREPDRKQQFILWLIQRINDHGNGRDEMKAMTVEEMMQACPLDIEPDRYQRRIIDEMARTNDGIKRVSTSPDLYLPREELFLRIALRQMPLDSESELGKAEVIRMRYEVDRRAGVARSREGLSYWETFIRKMSSLYGWSDDFGRGLVLDVLNTSVERRKTELEEEKKKIQEMERTMRGG